MIYRRKMATPKILLCLVIVSLSLSIHVCADQIFPAHLAGTFSRSNREPKYKIEFFPEDAPFYPDDDQESMVMLDKHGRKHLCYLPKEEKEKSDWTSSHQNVSNVIMETEKPVKLKTPDELLQPLSDKCLLRQEGWWSYEFCHLRSVRQLHIEDDNKVVQEFILGNFDADATAAFNENLPEASTMKDPRSSDASLRYHSHLFTNGTICDLTGKPREIEVRFVCAETRAMVTSMTELSTCKYALTVQCPTLCKHPLFQQEKPVWHTIHCNAVAAGEDDAATATRTEEERQHLDEEPTKMITDS
ncbi:PREDICTED: protein OS-9 homolog [Tarenaya hassleriana]|uniref:protein OS-9 homolog n=1 Tax=Tarenaya hassleriana TaxID=28532 RepID=UPI00053C4844|nr:PREDICTED: protein OS-9 homolog [Tarenaya hassleriana]